MWEFIHANASLAKSYEELIDKRISPMRDSSIDSRPIELNMPTTRISWSSILTVIGALGLITGLAVNLKTLVPTFSPTTSIREDFKYLDELPPLVVSHGNIVDLTKRSLAYSEIRLEDDSQLIFSDATENISISTRKIIVGSGVKILGVGETQPPAASGSTGAHGGRCSTGGSGSAGKPGSNGSDGVNIDIHTLELDFLAGSLRVDLSGGAGGDGGDGGRGGKGGEASLNRDCRGGDGGQGGNGGSAGSGGNGGNLSIAYHTASFKGQAIGRTQVEHRYIEFLSDGGASGNPGAPGQGGTRGEGKSSEIFGSLDSEPGGNPGSPGQLGPPGKEGQDGKLQLILLAEDD